ncbi:MAG: HpaII family restriction endonuclease [Flavobacterium psychrophilum]|nr:MAG: HpaII family restriction endonuclease [Flavobacterium psychrophilum]
MLTGNKGEWSEVYALFKLLADGKLYPGDKNINKITSLFFPIIKIIKNELGVDFEYELNGNVVIIDDKKQQFTIPIEEFRQHSIKLLSIIKSKKGAFGDSDIESFMSSFNSKKLKAKSSAKSDIRVVIHDLRINQSADLGFSIKSELGGDSTLLNAGETTNFIYKIEGHDFTHQEIIEINEIDTKNKIKDRVEKILSYNTKITFIEPNRQLFKNNLTLIDSLLPNILGELTYLFYTSKHNSIAELTSTLQTHNPLNFDLQFSHTYYEYKIKRFLTDVALGMMPSKIWSGLYDTTGGYLIVKSNGDVLCYHVYNRNQFEDYLFYNTRLDTASSTKHKFGVLYKEASGYYFKLNLQVRF